MPSSPNTFEHKLEKLQSLLGYSKEKLTCFRVYGTSEEAVLGFLSRFLNAADTPEAAVAKLSLRRNFERTLPSLSITAGILLVLRSGAFRVLGRDAHGRVIFYVYVRHLSSLSELEVDEAQRLFILLMEYLQFLATVVGTSRKSSNRNSNNTSTPIASRNHLPFRHGANTQNENISAFSSLFEDGHPSLSISSSRGASHAAVQEVVFLINEEGAEWQTQQSLISRVETFFSILGKFYPGLIGLVLIVGAGMEIRNGIHKAYSDMSNASSSPSSITCTTFSLEFISRSTLSEYIPLSLIPAELGGSCVPISEGRSNGGRDMDDHRPSVDSTYSSVNDHKRDNTSSRAGGTSSRNAGYGALAQESPAEFSETVLRQWYTLTAFLLEEEAVLLTTEGKKGPGITSLVSSSGSEPTGCPGGSEGVHFSSAELHRPLYLLPPHRIVLSCYANAVGSSRINGHGLGSRLAMGDGGYRRWRSMSNHHCDPATFSPSSARREVCSPLEDTASITEGGGDDNDDDDDDGLCSLATDLDGGSFSPDITERFLQEEMDAEHRIASNAHLMNAYRVECAMRKAAERRLEAARAEAIPLPLQNAAKVEKVLMTLHKDVNQLIHDIVKRATMEQKYEKEVMRHDHSLPTPAFSLEELLDTTIAALGVAAGVAPSTIPTSMTSSPAVQRMEKEEKESCCCCCC